MKKPNSFLLLFFFAYGYVLALIISPALPLVESYFQVSSGTSQLAFSIYIAGFAIAQLIYGPLANHFGRKKAMQFAIYSSLIFSFLCLVALWRHNFALFVLSRFLQAVSACGCLVLTFIVVSDVFQGIEKKRFIAFFTVTFAIGCFLAVLIGGWLIRYFPLTSIFYFCLLLGILEVLNIFTFPETSPSSQQKVINIGLIIKRYAHLFTRKRFIYLSLFTGGPAGIAYFFNQSAPFIGIEDLNMTSASFADWNLVTYLSILLGAFLVRFLLKYISSRVLLFFNLVVGSCVAIGFFSLFVLGFVSKWTLFIPSGLLFLFFSGLYPLTTSWALESCDDLEYGSSLLSFLYVGGSFVALLIAGLIHTKNPLQLPMIIIGIILTMWLLIVLASKASEKKSV